MTVRHTSTCDRPIDACSNYEHCMVTATCGCDPSPAHIELSIYTAETTDKTVHMEQTSYDTAKLAVLVTIVTLCRTPGYGPEGGNA